MSKNIDTKKFNSNEKAKRYISELGYNLKDYHCFQRGQVFSIHQEVFKTTGVS